MKTKRHSTTLLALALLAGLLFTGALPAAALEVNVTGQFIMQWGLRDGYDQHNDYWKIEGYSKNSDHFFARQRARIQVEFVASENLKGVLQMQFGTTNWGDSSTGGQLDTTSSTGKVRRAYIDWNVADTSLNVKMGLQEIALPSAVAGNPILDSHVAAIVLASKLTDEITLSGFWARPHTKDNPYSEYKRNHMDMFGLLADFNYESVTFRPYLLYSSIGDNSWPYNEFHGSNVFDGHTDYYLAGLALQVKPMERLTIGLDAVYNYMDNDSSMWTSPSTGLSSKVLDKSSGWFAALGVDYALDFGTLGLVAWYASGHDYDDLIDSKPKFGRIRNISNSVSGFAPARLAFEGAYAIGDDSLVSTSGAGTWGLGLHFKDFSFVEDLSHTVRLVYFQGTDDKELSYAQWTITTKDKAFEIDFDTTYQIAKGFKAVAEIAYLRLDYEDRQYGWQKAEEDLWSVQLTLDYSF